MQCQSKKCYAKTNVQDFKLFFFSSLSRLPTTVINNNAIWHWSDRTTLSAKARKRSRKDKRIKLWKKLELGRAIWQQRNTKNQIIAIFYFGWRDFYTWNKQNPTNPQALKIQRKVNETSRRVHKPSHIFALVGTYKYSVIQLNSLYLPLVLMVNCNIVYRVLSKRLLFNFFPHYYWSRCSCRRSFLLIRVPTTSCNI